MLQAAANVKKQKIRPNIVEILNIWTLWTVEKRDVNLLLFPTTDCGHSLKVQFLVIGVFAELYVGLDTDTAVNFVTFLKNYLFSLSFERPL